MVKVRAGSFSASLSADGQLYVWGEGTFGQFYTPHRIKSAKVLDIQDFAISRAGLAAVISRSGTCYTWGHNDVGQLGHGDFKPRQTPQRVKYLEGKKVTSIGLGEDFCIALGLTLPQHEYAKLAAQNGVLKQNLLPEKTKKAENRPNIRRIKAAGSGAKTSQTNYQDVMQNSHAPAGDNSCALRQKSLGTAYTTSNLIQANSGLKDQKNRTGLSVTST